MTSRSVEFRSYREQDAAVIYRTRDRFGELSNMAGGMSFDLAGVQVRSTEAYYQALRFPHLPEVQKRILEQRNPIIAKRTAYEYLSQSRADWLSVNVRVMRFALRIKAAHHGSLIRDVLRETGDRPIVEKSLRDDFWGAIPDGKGQLSGRNVLGRLWMELRAELEHDPDLYTEGVEDPKIPQHRILGLEINGIELPSLLMPMRLPL